MKIYIVREIFLDNTSDNLFAYQSEKDAKQMIVVLESKERTFHQRFEIQEMEVRGAE